MSLANPFPPEMEMHPLTRSPVRLPEQTLCAAMTLPPPRAPRQAIDASVILVTLDNLPFTRLCIASLLGDEEPPAQIIVVDNASSDGTPAYLGQLAQEHPGIEPILNKSNLGFAPAVNLGLARARGRVVVLLNNDTIVAPGWLPRLGRHLLDPWVGAAGPVTNRSGNEAEVEVTYQTYAQFRQFAQLRGDQHRHRNVKVPMLSMFCLAARRDVLAQVGPLDERYQVGMFEDDDYAKRLTAAGFRMVCAQDVFVHHFAQATFGALKPTGEYARLFAANRQKFEEKWGCQWQPHRRARGEIYQQMIGEIRAAAATVLPTDAVVAVVSRGDDALLELGVSQAWHCPRGADGLFLGHNPRDGAAALLAVESLRLAGATHLLIPGFAMWWLDHYRELRNYLETRSTQLFRDASCAIMDLRSSRGRVLN